MKITQKLPLFFLLTGFIPIIGVGLVSYFNTQTALNQQINTQINNVASRQASRVQDLVKKDLESRGLFPTDVTVNIALQQYVTTPSQTAQDDLNRTLQETARFDNRFRRIHILSLAGEVIGSTDQTFLGRDYSGEEVFAKRDSGASAWMFFRDADGRLAIYLFGPIVYVGQLQGYSLLETPIEHYLLATGDYSDLGQTGETLLLRRLDSGDYQYQTPARFNDELALTPYNEQQGLDYRGKKVLSVQRDIPGTPLVVVVKIDYDEVYEPLINLRNAAIGIILISSAAATGFGLFLARRLTNPLRSFTDIVQRIEAGNLSLRVPIQSKDEIGTLGMAFNNMTDQLASAYQNLEQKVRDRTRDLDEKIKELARSNAKDEAILSSIGDGMIVTDRLGKILLINNVAANLLGIDPQITSGKFHLDAYGLLDESGKPLPTGNVPIQLALRHGQKVNQDVQVAGEGGKKRSLGITATPVMQDGAVIGAIQTIRDITKEKEVNRMKTEFISIASHQLRTPLSAIKWFIELLTDDSAGKLSDMQTDLTKKITASTERMIDLVNSLLNISRIESGRIIIDPKPTDLNELIGGIVSDLKGKTEKKRQNLNVSVQPSLPAINLDPNLIGQVILNLLTNAIKYTPEGGKISVEVARQGDWMVTRVSDNGYGIPKAQQGRLFEKFFRADNIIKVEADGTGLGLYLVKAVIESSGGKIWFNSEESKGTTFWFALPMSGMKAKEGEVRLGS